MFSFFLFFFSPLLSSLPTSFGCWLRGLPLSQGKGSRRDRAPLPRQAGCLSEPRSESVGVTKEKGASTWEEKVLYGPKSQGAGRGRGPGRLEEVEENTRSSARRLDRATNQLGAQTAQPPRGCTRRRVWRAAGSPPGRRRSRPGGPGGGGDRSCSEPPSLPFHLPASAPGGQRARGSVVLPLHWESRDLRTPAWGPPSTPCSYNPQPTPSRALCSGLPAKPRGSLRPRA